MVLTNITYQYFPNTLVISSITHQCFQIFPQEMPHVFTSLSICTQYVVCIQHPPPALYSHNFVLCLSSIHKPFSIFPRILCHLKKNLFIYLVAPGLCCSRRAPQLRQAGSQLGHENSQLRHACGIQCPDQGSNPGPLHYWEHGFLTAVSSGKSPLSFLKDAQRRSITWLHHYLLNHSSMVGNVCFFQFIIIGRGEFSFAKFMFWSSCVTQIISFKP